MYIVQSVASRFIRDEVHKRAANKNSNKQKDKISKSNGLAVSHNNAAGKAAVRWKTHLWDQRWLSLEVVLHWYSFTAYINQNWFPILIVDAFCGLQRSTGPPWMPALWSSTSTCGNRHLPSSWSPTCGWVITLVWKQCWKFSSCFTG